MGIGFPGLRAPGRPVSPSFHPEELDGIFGEVRVLGQHNARVIYVRTLCARQPGLQELVELMLVRVRTGWVLSSADLPGEHCSPPGGRAPRAVWTFFIESGSAGDADTLIHNCRRG